LKPSSFSSIATVSFASKTRQSGIENEDPRNARIAANDDVTLLDDDGSTLHAVASCGEHVVCSAGSRPLLEVLEEVGGLLRGRTEPLEVLVAVHTSSTTFPVKNTRSITDRRSLRPSAAPNRSRDEVYVDSRPTEDYAR